MLTTCMMAALGLGDPILTAGDGVSVRAEGTLRLRCMTRWHNLDLELKARKSVPLGTGALHVLHPPKLDPAEPWTVKGDALAPLARALHAVPWESRDTDEEAYARWQGSMATKQTVTHGGHLALKLGRTAEGYRVTFTGKVKVIDEGWLGNRYGPNGWRHEWTHTLKGEATLDKEGRVLSCTFDDRIAVAGKFHSGTLEDPFTQEGKLTLALKPVKPLDRVALEKVKGLIAQLGSEDFAAREKASAELRKLGEGAAPLLRVLGLASPDPEVRRRTREILRRLP